MITYRSGDHVYRKKATKLPSGLHLGGHNPENYEHGTVTSHTHHTAKVQWEGGHKTTHLQSNGMTVGDHVNHGTELRHSKSSLVSPGAHRVSNEDHKKMLQDEHIKQMKQHEDRVKLGLRAP